MRGLTDKERWILGGPYHLERDFEVDEEEAALALQAAGRATLQCCPRDTCGSHFYPTAAGKLALELDTLARKGGIDV